MFVGIFLLLGGNMENCAHTMSNTTPQNKDDHVRRDLYGDEDEDEDKVLPHSGSRAPLG